MAGLLFLVEATAMPIGLNGTSPEEELATPPAEVLTGDRIPPVYRHVATLPRDTVLVELPFGADQYELRYLYYSTVHWRPILNGYSGGFPLSYLARKHALLRPLSNPLRAGEALDTSPATHAIVHEAAFLGDEGANVSRWLESKGARLVQAFGSDKLYVLRRGQ